MSAYAELMKNALRFGILALIAAIIAGYLMNWIFGFTNLQTSTICMIATYFALFVGISYSTKTGDPSANRVRDGASFSSRFSDMSLINIKIVQAIVTGVFFYILFLIVMPFAAGGYYTPFPIKGIPIHAIAILLIIILSWLYSNYIEYPFERKRG